MSDTASVTVRANEVTEGDVIPGLGNGQVIEVRPDREDPGSATYILFEVPSDEGYIVMGNESKITVSRH